MFKLIHHNTYKINKSSLFTNINRITKFNSKNYSTIDDFLKSNEISPTNDDFVNIQMEGIVDSDWIKNKDNNKFIKNFSIDSNKHIIVDNLRDYLISRNCGVIIDNASALRLTSQFLTYPLSLSYGLHKILTKHKTEIRILVVGARSESELPKFWWRETLFSSNKYDRFLLSFLGPDTQQLNRNLPEEEAEPEVIAWGNYDRPDDFIPTEETLRNSKRLLINFDLPNNNTELHNHEDVLEVFNLFDVFMLYNPGLGSDVLKRKWQKSLELLLDSSKTVICTATSLHDCKRDIIQIQTIAKQFKDKKLEFLILPHENPFKSLSRVIDNNEQLNASIIHYNHYIYAFQLSK